MKKDGYRSRKTLGLNRLRTAELSAFGDYLRALSVKLAGMNYAPLFDVKAFGLASSTSLPVREIMLEAYPWSRPDEARITKCSVDLMVKMTDACLVLDDVNTFRSEDAVDTVTRAELRAEFWAHLKNCIDYESADIYDYNSESGLPGYHTFWRFAWLIHNLERKRCVFLYGVASD